MRGYYNRHYRHLKDKAIIWKTPIWIENLDERDHFLQNHKPKFTKGQRDNLNSPVSIK